MLSLCPLSVLPCTPLEQIDAATRAGFDAIGVRAMPALASDADILSDARMIAGIRSRLADSGLKVLEMDVVRIGPDLDVAALEPLLSFGGEIGCRHLTVTGRPKADCGPGDEQETVRRLAALCDRAATYRIRPIIEFMAFRDIGTLEDAVRFVNLAGHPNLGVCVDLLHLHRSGGTVATLRKVDPGLIACVHLSDAPFEAPAPADLPAESRLARLDPGEGGLPLAEFLAGVKSDVPIGVEVPSRSHSTPAERASELARKTRAFLASLKGADGYASPVHERRDQAP